MTPLQVAVAYAAIANGGTLYQPRLVKKIKVGEQDISFEPSGRLVGVDEKSLAAVKYP